MPKYVLGLGSLRALPLPSVALAGACRRLILAWGNHAGARNSAVFVSLLPQTKPGVISSVSGLSLAKGPLQIQVVGKGLPQLVPSVPVQSPQLVSSRRGLARKSVAESPSSRGRGGGGLCRWEKRGGRAAWGLGMRRRRSRADLGLFGLYILGCLVSVYQFL